jgi:serine/threonine protein kinase
METGKQFAIKILKPHLSEGALKTIMTEINALKVIEKHPNVVTLHDFDKHYYVRADGKIKGLVNYIVLDLAAGGELFNIIS